MFTLGRAFLSDIHVYLIFHLFFSFDGVVFIQVSSGKRYGKDVSVDDSFVARWYGERSEREMHTVNIAEHRWMVGWMMEKSMAIK